jgi:hypothetical protein
MKDSYQRLQDKSVDCATSIKPEKAKIECLPTALKNHARDIQSLIEDNRLTE